MAKCHDCSAPDATWTCGRDALCGDCAARRVTERDAIVTPRLPDPHDSQTIQAIVPLPDGQRFTPDAHLTVSDDAVAWIGRRAIGRVAAIQSSHDGAAVLVTVELLPGVDDLTGASLEGLSIEGLT